MLMLVRARRACWFLLAAVVLTGVASWLHNDRRAVAVGIATSIPEAAVQQRDRILVFAPHPDDETLGCGGLIQQALARGAEVHVALMTNGDASELALLFGERELSRKPKAFIDLGQTRQRESLAALAGLGLSADRVHFLGYPNNGLVALWSLDHWLRSHPYRSKTTKATASPYPDSVTPGAVYCGEQALADVSALLRTVRPSKVYVTHPQDIHPDHWATCAFVSYALAGIASEGREEWADTVRLYGYLIHWPHYPSPPKRNSALALQPPRTLAAERPPWLEVPLSSAEAEAKLGAIRRYRSQLPGLDRLLPHFARTNELFEELPVLRAREGVPLVWDDEESRRRSLGGAEMLRTRLRISRDGWMNADLLRAPQKLKKRMSISLDVRGFDDQGRPTATTVQLLAKGEASKMTLSGGRVSAAPTKVSEVTPGRVTIGRLRFAPNATGGRAFVVTCWGGTRDRAIDPAVVSRVALAQPVP
jgi:LmbE family N-acetylglucosaminyl deacetylase